MELRPTLVAQNYLAARPATEPAPKGPSDTANHASPLGSFAETLREGENIALQSMTGQADPHALVQALAQSELAVEAASAVRNKVVEAYQEILRMPV